LPEPAAEAVVIGTDVASRSFRERLPARLAAWLVGLQPILTFVSVGELAQWTKLRHGGPRNLAMPGSWLAGKPVIPGSKAIAAIWGGLSAAAIQRGRPCPANGTWVAGRRLACQLPLAILNLKDFKDFAEHTGCGCSSRSRQQARTAPADPITCGAVGEAPRGPCRTRAAREPVRSAPARDHLRSRATLTRRLCRLAARPCIGWRGDILGCGLGDVDPPGGG